MTVVRRTTLVTWAPGSGDEGRGRVVACLEAASVDPVVVESWVRPTLPGTVRGGDLVWHLAFADERARAGWNEAPPSRRAHSELRGPAVQGHTSATYDEGRTGTRVVAGDRAVHRTLLLRVPVGAETLVRFEDELFAMGEAIPVMRRWRLSRARESEGGSWTHVWEQVFADPSGLEHDYMRHPYHWGHVDRWFDGESPDRIVEPTFCHTFCLLDPPPS